MQPLFEFPLDSTGTWIRLLNNIWGNNEYLQLSAQYFGSIEKLSYLDLIKNYDYHCKELLKKLADTKILNSNNYGNILISLRTLKNLLLSCEPSRGYSVSLSKVNNEMLMWAHYADSHKGFCLVLRPINGKITQCPKRRKTSLIVSDGHSSAIGYDFQVEDITYDNRVNPIDAFTMLPMSLTGYREFDSEETRIKYHELIRKQLLVKNECWDYEKECRLLLKQPQKFISGEFSYTSFQRLFHYDFTQVVGIIFGSRMSPSEKENIRSIINQKIVSQVEASHNSSDKKYIFDFLYQQAEMNSSRSITINDLEIISMGTELKPGSSHYKDRIEKWKSFKGITVKDKSYTYEEIP
ncbi:MAG: DUF2971 domain-containing protein [Leptothrix sp. (in: b-proteobacteria)]